MRRPWIHSRNSKAQQFISSYRERWRYSIPGKAQQFRVLLRTLATIGFGAAMQFHVLQRTVTVLGSGEASSFTPCRGRWRQSIPGRAEQFYVLLRTVTTFGLNLRWRVVESLVVVVINQSQLGCLARRLQFQVLMVAVSRHAEDEVDVEVWDSSFIEEEGQRSKE